MRQDWPFGDLPMFGFDFIMADPPWHFVANSKEKPGKTPQAHYATMTMQEIAALPVADLGKPDCLLWLWATNPMVNRQIEIAVRWGFAFKTVGVWVKQAKNGGLAFGTGYRLRNANELFIIATKGKPVTTKSVRSVVQGPVRAHSQKPDEAYAAAEAMMPGAVRCDLFARQSRPGWASWGNEATKFDGAAA